MNGLSFLYPFLPETVFAVSFLLFLTIDLLYGEVSGKRTAIFCLAILILSFIASLVFPYEGVGKMLRADSLTDMGRALLLFSGFFTVGFIYRFLKDRKKLYSEKFYVLLVLILGAIFLVRSEHFLMFFLSLETISICSYILAASGRGIDKEPESSMKYFMLGALSSTVILYGIALIYGAAGTLDFAQIPRGLAENHENAFLVQTGLILFLFGIAFKLALFPLHIWSPDVYEGVCTPVTAIFAVLPKIAIFIALTQVLRIAFADQSEIWKTLLSILASLSMIYGNLGALKQTSLKRLFAYSSIAHSGYITIAVISSYQVEYALTVYLLSYSILNLGVFGTLILLGKEKELLLVSDLKGFGNACRGPALGFSLLLLGFAGFPLTVGFVGKIFVFYDGMLSDLVIPVIIGILTGIFSVYYYFKIIFSVLFAGNHAENLTFSRPVLLKSGVILLMSANLLLGVFPAIFGVLYLL